MPKGQPRNNRKKMSGDVPPEVFDELLRHGKERGLPSPHRVVSVIVEEWFAARKQSAQDPEPRNGGSG